MSRSSESNVNIECDESLSATVNNSLNNEDE